MSHHDELTTIDPSALDAVAGGVTSSSNAQLTTALKGITSSLATPATNNSSSALSSMMPLMSTMGKGGAGGGACPCGCGMANCMRR